MSAAGTVNTRYFCNVTYASGRVRSEGQCDDRAQAEQYCRTAVADGCRSAAVLLTSGGLQLSYWNREEVKRWDAAPGR